MFYVFCFIRHYLEMDMILILVMYQVGAPWAFTVGNIHVILVSELMPLSFVLWKLCACNIFRSHMVAGAVLWNFVDLHTQSVCFASSSFLLLKIMKILKLIKGTSKYLPPTSRNNTLQSWGLLVQFPLPITFPPPVFLHEETLSLMEFGSLLCISLYFHYTFMYS